MPAFKKLATKCHHKSLPFISNKNEDQQHDKMTAAIQNSDIYTS